MKRKIFTLLLSVIVFTNAFAQPAIKGQRTLGGNSDDLFSSMSFTKDHGLIAGGSSNSNISGEKTENSRGDFDYWIVKFDSLKKIQWDKTIGGNSYDRLQSVKQTKDGGYILGGTSGSEISGEKKASGTGAWVVKLDRSGDVKWDKIYNGLDEGYCCYSLQSLALTKDGGYIMTVLIIGDEYSSPIWVIKIGSGGNIQWNKTIAGEEQIPKASSVIQTTDGGYLVGSSTYNHSYEQLSYRGVKMDAQGNIQWNKVYAIGSSYGFSALYTILQTNDGNFLFGGISDVGYEDYPNNGYKTENSRGGTDYWLLKVDGQGNYVWDKTIGSSGNDSLKSVAETRDGGLILGGYSKSDASGEKTENSKGGYDYWIVKLNKNGKVQWDKTMGGSGDDKCYSVKEIGRNNYVIGGSSDSRISGDKTGYKRGGYDNWIVKLVYQKPDSFDIAEFQNENNIAAPKINSSNFTVYPNPAKDILHIQTKGNTTLSLTDQSGKVLFTKTINGKGEINITNLAAGLYYLKNNATGAVQKLIVEK